MPREEKVGIEEKGRPSRNRVMLPKEKSVLWMKDLIRKDSKPGQLIVLLRVDLFSTTKGLFCY